MEKIYYPKTSLPVQYYLENLQLLIYGKKQNMW